MDEELLGIVGGMGPYTDVYFLDRLIALNKSAQCDQDYPRTLLYSNTKVPCRVASFPKAKDAVIVEIVDGFKKLREAGATIGVMTCNTAHIFYDEIAAQIDMPILSIVEQTTRTISEQSRRDISSIGILATDATVNYDLYGRSFRRRGILVSYPNESEQKLISEAIFDKRFGVKATVPDISNEAMRNIGYVISEMRARDDRIRFLAGCTELSLAFGKMKDREKDIIDPLEILASVCLERIRSANGRVKVASAPHVTNREVCHS
ncbi:MAG: amino acid racemase [Gammaproteobacteria bacterium]|nr:amino acid racemase [Gammaproteobacteria bacterium]